MSQGEGLKGGALGVMVDKRTLHRVVWPRVHDAGVSALSIMALGHGRQLEGGVGADVFDVVC